MSVALPPNANEGVAGSAAAAAAGCWAPENTHGVPAAAVVCVSVALPPNAKEGVAGSAAAAAAGCWAPAYTHGVPAAEVVCASAVMPPNANEGVAGSAAAVAEGGCRLQGAPLAARGLKQGVAGVSCMP